MKLNENAHEVMTRKGECFIAVIIAATSLHACGYNIPNLFVLGKP